jgi:hypothetical protein
MKLCFELLMQVRWSSGISIRTKNVPARVPSAHHSQVELLIAAACRCLSCCKINQEICNSACLLKAIDAADCAVAASSFDRLSHLLAIILQMGVVKPYASMKHILSVPSDAALPRRHMAREYV